jgi:MFS transporter, DHA2 family, multidrug resistance protein
MSREIADPLTRKPLEGASLVWMTLGLSLATFMQVLDATIANVALPTISGDLGMATTQGTWVITAFGVANAIAVPLSGWLARQLGEVRLFLWSMLLFIVTSWLCGLANSLASLVFYRVLQGIAAGPLVPLAQSLLLNNYPPLKRALALSLWSLTIVIAPICGPILGGWISDNYHWGWIFFINIPIGLLALFVTWLTLKNRESLIIRQPIDTVGLLLLIIGVGCLQWLLDRGKELDWFASTEITLLTITSVVSLISLVIWELAESYPVLDLSLFKQRNFTIGVLCTSLTYGLYIGSIVLIPLLLQGVMGYTATWAGLAAAPIGLLPLILAPLIGRFSDRLDMRSLVTVSFLVFAFCFYWRSTVFCSATPFSAVVWPQFVQGMAIACFFMPLTAITLSGVPQQQLASASSLSSFLRVLTGSIGTSVVTTLWTQREALHHTRLTECLDPTQPHLLEFYQQLAQWGVDQLPASTYLAQQITAQGLIISANEIFWASALLFLVMILLVWCAKPPFGSGEVGH